MKIDRLDWHILRLLQLDATLSVQEIAEQVGLSNNPCWRRIKKLEEQGVIERRVAIVSPKAVGLNLVAFVTLRLERHSDEWLSSFADSIDSIPEIVECHRMTGDVDYLLKLALRDLAHYDVVYQTLIGSVPGLKDVSSTFSMEQLKHHNVIDASTAIA